MAWGSHDKYVAYRYGLPPGAYDAMETGQQGKCAICRRRPRGRRLTVDHDHNTGQVRGLLCNDCNLFLAKAETYLAATNSGYRPPLWTPVSSDQKVYSNAENDDAKPEATSSAKVPRGGTVADESAPLLPCVPDAASDGPESESIPVGSPADPLLSSTLSPAASEALPSDPLQALLLALQAAGERGAKVVELAVATGMRKTWVYDRLGELATTGQVARLPHSRWVFNSDIDIEETVR